MKPTLLCLLRIPFFLSLLFLFSSICCLQAQYVPIPMETKIASSEIIVEGRVSGQKTFWSDGNIYTENLIEVYQVIKGGQKVETVSVITLGGKVGNTVQTWTHVPAFSQNEYGVFFLAPTKRPVGEKQGVFYDVFSGSQGYYRVTGHSGELVATSVLESFERIEGLYERLGAVREDGSVSPFQAIEKSMNCLRIKVVPKFELPALSATFEADIFVRTTTAPVNIHSINVVIDYDTVTFGSNVVASGNLTSTDGELVTSYYDLDFSDYSSNQVEVVYEADGTDAASLEEVGTAYRKLATISLEIEGWSQEDPVSWDENSGVVDNYYVDGEGYVTEFDCTDVFVGANCDIKVDSLNVLSAAAGVGEESENGITGTVTIYGSGFGTPDSTENEKIPEGRRVKFRNLEEDSVTGGWISPYEGDYLSWTDSSIEVEVPSHGYYNDTEMSITDFNTQVACTGVVRVCQDEIIDGMLAPCDCFDDSGQLYIPFSARNEVHVREDGCLESIPVIMSDVNGEGGYTFYFGDGFLPTDTNWVFMRSKFKSALTTWRCNTFVNFGVDENSSFPGGDGAFLVELGFIPAGTGSVTSAKTVIDEEICSGGNLLTAKNAQLLSLTIVFNEDANWTVADFLEATALHEIGHAHLLNHTCNDTTKVMQYANTAEPISLHADDKDGGVHEAMLGESVSDATCDFPDPMELIDSSECVVPTVNIFEKEISVNIFPNPARNKLTIEFDSFEQSYKGTLSLINILGVEVLSTSKIKRTNRLNIDALGSGIYFVVLASKQGKRQIIGKFYKI